MYLALLNGLFLLRLGARSRTDLARLSYWCVLGGLFVFAAFRFQVGCDWGGYFVNYDIGADLDFGTALQDAEPVWWVIQVAFNRIGLPYPAVNVLTSAIFFAGVHALARRQPDRLGFLVLLFPVLIIGMPMSGIRQAAAIGFLCFAMVAFIDHRPIRFVGWILLGSTIHTSVLAFLLLTPLATGRFTNGRIAATLLLAGPGIAVLLRSAGAQQGIDRYLDTDLDAAGALFRVGMLGLSGLFFLILLRRSWVRQFPADRGLASIGAWMMLGLMALIPLSTVIADRLGYYLVPIQAMIFARVPFLNLGPDRRFLAVLPYLGLALMFAVWSLRSSHFQTCYVPYHSWLLGMPDFGRIGF